jgi:GTPase SAR1 family protein
MRVIRGCLREDQMCDKVLVLGGAMPCFLRFTIGRRFVLWSFVVLLCSNVAWAQNKLPELYQLKNISSNGNLTVAKYAFTSNLAIGQLSGVTVWQHLLTNEVVFPKIYPRQPDWKAELLSNGFVKLNNPDEEISRHIWSERFASNNSLGLWSQPVGAEKSDLGISDRIEQRQFFMLSGQIQSDTNLTPQTSLVECVRNNPNVRATTKIVSALFGIIFATATFFEVGVLIRGGFERRNVRLVIVGPKGAGKTSLYLRLRNPEIPTPQLKSELEETKGKASPSDARLPKFRFDERQVSVKCIDPGHNEELEEYAENGFLGRLEQFDHLRKLFFPETIIWLVVLATTESEFQGTMMSPFLEFQKGYLSLPLAMMRVKKRNPALCRIILCMNKADLFLSGDPNPVPQNPQHSNQLAGFEARFKYHKEVLRQACKELGIKFSVITCSAWNAWGIKAIQGVISETAAKGCNVR